MAKKNNTGYHKMLSQCLICALWVIIETWQQSVLKSVQEDLLSVDVSL